jgi:2-methylcitrate dehydratase PrpD
VLAVALADGAALLDQFTDERVAGPALAALRQRIHVHTDAAQRKDSARVVVTPRDGRTLERHVDHNLGTPDNPMTDEQLEAKFVGLAAPVLGMPRASQIAATCWRLLELPDIRTPLNLSIPE